MDKRDSHNPRTKPKLSFFGQRKPDKLGPRRQRFEEETALKEEEENQSLHTVEAMLEEIQSMAHTKLVKDRDKKGETNKKGFFPIISKTFWVGRIFT